MDVSLRKIFENLSHITFTFYIITLYIFADRAETLMWSKLAFLIFAACAGVYLLLNGKVCLHKYFLFIGGFVVYCCFSFFWSVDQEATLTKIISLVQLFIFSILIYHVFYFSGRMDIFVRALLLAGLILCVYAVYVYTWDGIVAALMSGSVRLGAEISQENVMGMQAAITFILCLYYALFKGKQVFYLVSVAPLILGMASGSKKTILIILVGVTLLLYLKTGLKKVYRFVIFAFLAVTIFNYIMTLPAFSMMNHRMDQFFSSLAGEEVSERSTITRLQMIEFGFNKFKESPIIGYGAGGAPMLYYLSTGRNTYLHNNFIEVLVNGGILGFAIFYSMYFYIVIKLFPLIKGKNMEAIIAVVILINRLVCDVAAVSYYDKMTYVYLMLGFLVVAKNSYFRKREM